MCVCYWCMCGCRFLYACLDVWIVWYECALCCVLCVCVHARYGVCARYVMYARYDMYDKFDMCCSVVDWCTNVMCVYVMYVRMHVMFCMLVCNVCMLSYVPFVCACYVCVYLCRYVCMHVYVICVRLCVYGVLCVCTDGLMCWCIYAIV